MVDAWLQWVYGKKDSSVISFVRFRVVMKSVSDFFRTTAISKLEFYESNADLFYEEEEEVIYRNLLSSDIDNSRLSMNVLQIKKRI